VTSSDSKISNPVASDIDDSPVVQSHPAAPRPSWLMDVFDRTVHSTDCSSLLDNFLKYNNLPLFLLLNLTFC